MIEIAESEKSDDTTKQQVMKSMGDLVKTKPCILELIEMKIIHKICEVFDKNAQVKGVIKPGLGLLLNIAKVREGNEILQQEGLGIKVASKIMNFGYPTKETLKISLDLIQIMGQVKNLNWSMANLRSDKENQPEKLMVLAFLLLDEKMCQLSLEKDSVTILVEIFKGKVEE